MMSEGGRAEKRCRVAGDVLRGKWDSSMMQHMVLHKRRSPMLYADDVFRIVILGCWPRYMLLNANQREKVEELYRRFEMVKEPEKLSEEEVEARVLTFVSLKRRESPSNARKREKDDRKTVEAVQGMVRGLKEAQGTVVLRPDAFGGFGVFAVRALDVDAENGKLVPGLFGTLSEPGIFSSDIAAGVYGTKSSLVTVNHARGSRVSALCGPLSYFNGCCKYCAAVRVRDVWTRAEFTGRPVQPGEEICLFYGDGYFDGDDVPAVNHDEAEFIIEPLDTPRELSSLSKCPCCRRIVSCGDLRAVLEDTLEWYSWIYKDSGLAKAVCELAAASNRKQDIKPQLARRILSRFKLRKADFEDLPAFVQPEASTWLTLRSAAQTARLLRHIAKYLIYGTRAPMLAGYKPDGFFKILLDPAELHAVRTAITTALQAPSDTTLRLIKRRIAPLLTF